MKKPNTDKKASFILNSKKKLKEKILVKNQVEILDNMEKVETLISNHFNNL